MTPGEEAESALKELHASLDERRRPEDVAELVLQVLGPRLRPEEAALLGVAAAGARGNGFHTSMPEDFARPVGGAAQLACAAKVFDLPEPPAVNPDDPAALRAVANGLGEALGWHTDHADFLAHRLDRGERQREGIELTARQYNRRWRALHRLAAKAKQLEHEQFKRRLAMLARSGFACQLEYERFRTDLDAACFIAYYTARRNLRREFSLSGRANPFDQISDALLARCERGERTDWAMVALVLPTPEVLDRLSDAQRGELLGRWSSVMHQAATLLGRMWRAGAFDRVRMVVRRGNDSSTWNLVAQGYNTARAAWLSCLAATGMERLLDVACPGKVMRLMAADLVQWHAAGTGELSPDTAVWAGLPLPWDVLDGHVECGRAKVEQVCERVGLDPRLSGWTAPRPAGAVAGFSPTPELVHGVSIADPAWAQVLRRSGYFSGRPIGRTSGAGD
ncbi:hypothetical protein JOF53_003477 [Crossiella equi]|uniref:Uncharacterized protein n=1 Tax=Crossiella equi TaxID=130796 RepID=A0ABS5ADE5_9PSEU|nr:hypothetical protein [Crossiella equi]MBP2474605.1 hypothetical protein [Crossiella equi]